MTKSFFHENKLQLLFDILKEKLLDSLSRSREDEQMAITKVLYINSSAGGGSTKHLKNAIEYISNEKKTEGKYIGSHHCSIDNCFHDFMETKRYYGKTDKRQAYHFVLSFAPGEVTPDIAFLITKRFCESYLQEYESIYTLHTDQKHLHSHIIFNSVNLMTGYKYRYEKGDWAKTIQPVTNALCDEFGLSQIEVSVEGETKKKARVYPEKKGRSSSNSKYFDEKTEEYNWSDHIRADLDELCFECNTFEELKDRLKGRGYQIREGKSEHKYFAIKAPGMERFRRTYRLGTDYTMENLIARMAIKNKPLPEIFIKENSAYCYLFPERIRKQYTKKYGKNTLTPMQKKYYAKMYRLGIRKRNTYVPYYKIRNNLRHIRKMEREIVFLNQLKISDHVSLSEYRKNVEKELADIKQKQIMLTAKKRPYKQVIAAWETMFQYQAAHECFQLTNNMDFVEENEAYLKAEHILKIHGVSFEELDVFLKQMKKEELKLKDEKKQALEKRKLLKEIEKEIFEEEEKKKSEETKNKENLRK